MMHRTPKQLIVFLFTMFLIAIILPSAVNSEVPQQINYQSVLKDSQGNFVNETVTMRFDIYDAAIGGNLLWGESQTVTVDDGMCNVEIGQDPVGNPFPINLFVGDRYLEIEINGEELSSRLHLTSVPFAMKAEDSQTLEGLGPSEFALSSHVHTWGEIAEIPADFADGVDDTGITSETDPTVLSSVKDGISWPEISNRPAGLDDGDDVGIGSETDPTVLSSVKDGVSWGELSDKPAGFADNVDNTGLAIEVDPQVGVNSTGYVPKWNGSALVSGAIYDNGNIGIGTTTPVYPLDVEGTVQGKSSESLGRLGSGGVGVYGKNISSDAYGFLGGQEPNEDKFVGVYGYGGPGIYGKHRTSGNFGSLGGNNVGAYGNHSSSGNYGFLGYADLGAYGHHNATANFGHLGSADTGAHGHHAATGNFGHLGLSGGGAYGRHNATANQGYLGHTNSGVYGETPVPNTEVHTGVGGYHLSSGNHGLLGHLNYGVAGHHANGNHGTLGNEYDGVSGYHEDTGNHGYLASPDAGAFGAYKGPNPSDITAGALGTPGAGVYGIDNGTQNFAALGRPDAALFAEAGDPDDGTAGFFVGFVRIHGTLMANRIDSYIDTPADIKTTGTMTANHISASTLNVTGSKNFRIDHPLDPENKYLVHASIESSDRMNIYNGIAALDESGEADVELPQWFQALNKDFRYQLTCIGGFSPVYIAEEVSDNRFRIAGGQPGMRVSWQVTGIRQDPYAAANPLVVEEV